MDKELVKQATALINKLRADNQTLKAELEAVRAVLENMLKGRK